MQINLLLQVHSDIFRNFSLSTWASDLKIVQQQNPLVKDKNARSVLKYSLTSSRHLS